MFTPNKCVHLEKSSEAQTITEDLRREVTTVWLCNFPENNPQKFVDCPRWITKLIYPGLAVTPETDCVKCPAYFERSE